MNTAKDNFSFSAGVNGLGNVGFKTADARDNFSMNANVMGLGNVGFSTADQDTCAAVGERCMNDKACCASNRCHNTVCKEHTNNKDNFSIGGSFMGIGAGISFADNSLTCDSQGNCMLKDKLAGSDRNTWSPQSRLAAKDNFSFSAGIPGLGNVGFSTADENCTTEVGSAGRCHNDKGCCGNNRCHKTFCKAPRSAGVTDNSLTCDSEGNCMLKDSLLYGANSNTWTPKTNLAVMKGADRTSWSPSRPAKDNFSFSAGIPGLGNVGFSTADSETCTTEVGRDARCLNNNGCCGTNKCHKSFCALPHVPRSTNNMLTDNLHETPGRCDANNCTGMYGQWYCSPVTTQDMQTVPCDLDDCKTPKHGKQQGQPFCLQEPGPYGATVDE